MLRNKMLRTVGFLLLGIMMLSVVSTIMASRAADSRVYQYFGGFYEEERDSLDAVYIGSSATYSAWLAPLAWERYGLAISPFCCMSQPFVSAEYVIREARKTQPNALYIVPIRPTDNIIDVRVHYLADNMPLSWNKIQLVWKMGEYMGITWEERLEYLFPIIRYHTRWTGLSEMDFFEPIDGLNGSSHYKSFLRTSTDVTSKYRKTERTVVLSEMLQDALDSLLEYCAAEQINVLFVETARLDNEYSLAEINSIRETVEAHGYPVLSLQPSVEELGLDTTKDYYNAHHTNIHGAIKITDYISRYLIENYDFEDKRGDLAYSTWDEAYDKYTAEYASIYTLDVEWNGEPRDSMLAAPELSKLSVNGTSLTLSWKSVPGADGYRIYRKLDVAGENEALGWQEVETVEADVLKYTESGCEVGKTYRYTVIAYREIDGTLYWGDYDFTGLAAKALLNVPELLSLEGAENDLTLTWEPVEGADGYYIYRRLPSKSWSRIADVEKGTTSFTDTDMLSDMPYQYRVRAYYYEEDGTTKTLGSYDANGLLYTPELELPTLEAVEEDGAILLSWERIEGIQGYTVYRRTENSKWEQVTTGNLSEASTQFRDITAQAGIRYAYKIEAYINAGEQARVYTLETGPDWIEIGEAMYNTAMPEIVYLSQTWNQVYVAWEPAAGVSSYRVYRRALSEDGSWSKWKSIKASVTGTTYLDTPSETGTYEYLVQALFAENSLIYYGVFDETGGVSISFESKSS